METYFQVLNDHNTLQIDDSYMNLALVRKATVTVDHREFAYSHSVVTRRSANLQLMEGEVLAAAAPRDELAEPFSVSVFGGSVHVFGPGVGKPRVFDVFLFGFPSRAPAARYGLEIYNAAGAVVFSSAHKYMRVLAARSGPLSVGIKDTARGGRAGAYVPIVDRRPGQRVALTQSLFPFYFSDGNPQGHEIGTFGASIRSGSVGLQSFEVGMSDWQDLNDIDVLHGEFSAFHTFMLIDVTGY